MEHCLQHNVTFLDDKKTQLILAGSWYEEVLQTDTPGCVQPVGYLSPETRGMQARVAELGKQPVGDLQKMLAQERALSRALSRTLGDLVAAEERLDDSVAATLQAAQFELFD